MAGAQPDVSLTSTPNAQLEAIRGQQQDYTEQLKTNTTLQENTGRLGIADSLEAQKAKAKQEAIAAGRQWTNADERDWADRSGQQQTQAANSRLLGRENNVRQSIADQLPTVNSQISQNAQQQALQLQAAGQAAGIKQSQAELEAQQQYQQAMLKAEQERSALMQAQQLSTLMYGPYGPGAGGGAQPPPAAPMYGPPANTASPGVGGGGVRPPVTSVVGGRSGGSFSSAPQPQAASVLGSRSFR